MLRAAVDAEEKATAAVLVAARVLRDYKAAPMPAAQKRLLVQKATRELFAAVEEQERASATASKASRAWLDEQALNFSPCKEGSISA